MVEARTFETDLRSMEEINHLNDQRARIAALLHEMKERVDEERESDGK